MFSLEHTHCRTKCFLNQVVYKVLELGLGEPDVEMLGTIRSGRDEGQRHLRGGETVQFPLGLLSRLDRRDVFTRSQR